MLENDTKTRKWLEHQFWPDGRICGHCGGRNSTPIEQRPGHYLCTEPKCGKEFTVQVGNVFRAGF